MDTHYRCRKSHNRCHFFPTPLSRCVLFWDHRHRKNSHHSTQGDKDMSHHKHLTRLFSFISLLMISMAAAASEPASHAYDKAVQAIVSDLNQHKTDSFNKAIDAEAILDKTFDGLMLDANVKSGVRASLKTAIQTKIANSIIEHIPAGGHSKVLRIKPVANLMTALVRLDYGDNGNAYYDLQLSQSPNGSIRIVDWYDYSFGQTYSQNLRQIVAMISPTPTLLGKVFDIASNRTKAMDDMMELIKLYHDKKHDKVVLKVLSMDEDMRKNRMLSIIAVQSGNMSGNERLYHQALANLEHYYRDDPSMTFLLIDYYFLEKRFDKVISATDQLMKSFGVDDASLYTIKANALAGQGKYGEAVIQAEHATSSEPDYEIGYWSLLSASSKARNYAKAVETAQALEKRFSYNLGPEALSKDATFAPLIQSAEYKKWRSTRNRS